MVGVHVKKKPHLRRPHIPRIHGNRKTSSRSNGSTWSYQKTLHCTRPHHLLSLSLSRKYFFQRPTGADASLLFSSLPHPSQQKTKRKSPIWYTHRHFTCTKSIRIRICSFRFQIFDCWFWRCIFRFCIFINPKKKKRRRKGLFLGFLLHQMAAPPVRARADYDYLIKLLLIGDSGKCAFVFMRVYK